MLIKQVFNHKRDAQGFCSQSEDQNIITKSVFRRLMIDFQLMNVQKP